MIQEPMPIDLTPDEIADLVASDTRRRLVSGLDELMMMNPTEPYEPRIARLVIDVAALDDNAANHFVTAKQIQEAAQRLREQHLPVLDGYGILEYDRDDGLVRATKSTMLFAAAVDEINDAVVADNTEQAVEAWLETAERGPI